MLNSSPSLALFAGEDVRRKVFDGKLPAGLAVRVYGHVPRDGKQQGIQSARPGIVAVRGDVGTQVKMLIEAKKYSPDRPVGVGLVRQLYAVRQLRHASKAVLATTSRFSRDAYEEFAEVIPWELELNDYDEILKWLKAYGGR